MYVAGGSLIYKGETHRKRHPYAPLKHWYIFLSLSFSLARHRFLFLNFSLGLDRVLDLKFGISYPGLYPL